MTFLKSNRTYVICAVSLALGLATTACGGGVEASPDGTVRYEANQGQPAQNVQPTYASYDESIELPVRILFENGSASLTMENQRLLHEAVATLRGRTDIVRVEIRGHTDSQGSDRLNSGLSMQRANEVMRFLVHEGVPPTESSRPRRSGRASRLPRTRPAQSRAQNRRVDFRALVRRSDNAGNAGNNGTYNSNAGYNNNNNNGTYNNGAYNNQRYNNTNNSYRAQPRSY